MTQFLPPNLLALFAARDPVPYLPPAAKLPHEKKQKGYDGVGAFLHVFEHPSETPPPTRVETREERLERKRRERAEQTAYKLEQEIALWDPTTNPRATTDPFKTLFVARVNYDTSESKLRREFEGYGAIKKIFMVFNKENDKPRGYAFIEYEHERDMHSAYKHADGKKIDGKRVLVDVERARTVKGWLPRRLGGGLGGTRRGGADVNIKHSGREDNERERERYRLEQRSRDERQRHDRGGGGNAARRRSRSRSRRRSGSRSRRRADRPDRPERPERAERPERPEREPREPRRNDDEEKAAGAAVRARARSAGDVRARVPKSARVATRNARNTSSSRRSKSRRNRQTITPSFAFLHWTYRSNRSRPRRITSTNRRTPTETTSHTDRLFSSQKLTDPFSCQKLTDPFSCQILTDPFSRQKLTDPFSRQKLTDPFSCQKLTDPFCCQKLTDPFSCQKPTGSFSCQKPTSPFRCQKPTGPFSCQYLRIHSQFSKTYGFIQSSQKSVLLAVYPTAG